MLHSVLTGTKHNASFIGLNDCEFARFENRSHYILLYLAGTQVSHLGAAVAEMSCGSVLGVARFVQVNLKKNDYCSA